MLSVKQGGIKYHFLSLWYDSTWDWTTVSRAIGEHLNGLVERSLKIYFSQIVKTAFFFLIWIPFLLLKPNTLWCRLVLTIYQESHSQKPN